MKKIPYLCRAVSDKRPFIWKYPIVWFFPIIRICKQHIINHIRKPTYSIRIH